MTHFANEVALVNEARAGNCDAFNALVHRYDQNVYRLAVNITRNHEDAEDVRQEALFKAYSNLGRFRGGSRFSTWLVRIALNEALMKLRKRRTGRQVSLDELLETDDQSLKRETTDRHDDPEQRYARTELEESLRQAIAHLDEPSRAVLMLRDVENLSTRETGAMLGLSITTVKTRLRRARLDVRQKLGPQIKKSLT
ncbi:MAG: RNA polymerase subunit sigma-24 [Acidobacteria bacterium]|nr:MAG: RNA polymerase subunit sigma-24 [Acidobacteriota bacterium]